MTFGYLVSLPALRFVVENYLSKKVDMKVVLKESMVLYNVAQVALNGWMVYRFVDAVANRGHPFIGDIHTVSTDRRLLPELAGLHACPHSSWQKFDECLFSE